MNSNKTLSTLAIYAIIFVVGIQLIMFAISASISMHSNNVNSLIKKDATQSQVSNKEALIDSRMAALTVKLNEYVINQAKDRDDIASATRDIFTWPVEAEKDYKYKLFQYKKTNTEVNFIRFSKSENHFSEKLCLKYNTVGFCKDNGFDNPDKLRMENDIEFYTSVITAGDDEWAMNKIKYDLDKEKYHSDTGIISHEKILEIFGLPDMN
ncbi:hypothetical protein SOX05_08695 [Pseudomonas putida]|nr:hypothetical protein [Pseudomonas putida]MDY4319339.1 hypothetical protein [Pseudomonas putida]MDY4352724.1 hypothetical protein [Pseudomonas putida]